MSAQTTSTNPSSATNVAIMCENTRTYPGGENCRFVSFEYSDLQKKTVEAPAEG